MNSLRMAGSSSIPVVVSARPPPRAMAELRRAHRIALVGTLLPAIAHDLGTPLGIVLARARLIESRVLSPAEEIRSGGIIAAQVDRMSRAIRRLIDFSDHGRASDGARLPGKSSVGLRALVERVADMLHPVAHRRQVVVALEPGAEVAASGDVWLLEQALVSLLMDLIEAMQSPGEVRLSVSRRRAAPPLGETSRRGDYACLAIQTPPHALMSRAWRTLVTGLTICQGIVREQGGWIAVLSPTRVPPSVTVYLPVCAS